jgi:hypothetical protein
MFFTKVAERLVLWSFFAEFHGSSAVSESRERKRGRNTGGRVKDKKKLVECEPEEEEEVEWGSERESKRERGEREKKESEGERERRWWAKAKETTPSSFFRFSASSLLRRSFCAFASSVLSSSGYFLQYWEGERWGVRGRDGGKD